MDDGSRYFRPHIARMQGYVPGEQPREGGFIKLNTNENPYPPAPLVLERLRQACTADLRLYPDADASALRRRLGRIFALDPAQIMVGNGSDELLAIIARSFAGEGDPIAFPHPTYGYYRPLVEVQGARAVAVDFPDDYSLPQGLATTGAPLTFLANPNAPSGTLYPSGRIAELAARLRGILVVDEAYVDFSRGGCLELVREYANVIVVRTMSKSFSLAGMRIGFAFAAPELVAGMWKVKDHYNVNRLSLVGGEAALEAMDYMRANAARIARSRERLVSQLRRLGFFVWDTEANFALARSRAVPARQLYQQLRERRILVRYFSQPRLDDCLRISVGTDAEIDALLAALGDLLAASPGGGSAACAP